MGRWMPQAEVSPFLIQKLNTGGIKEPLKTKTKSCKTHTQRWQGMKVTLPRFLAAAAFLGAATAYDTLLTTVSKRTQSKTHCHNGARPQKVAAKVHPAGVPGSFPHALVTATVV